MTLDSILALPTVFLLLISLWVVQPSESSFPPFQSMNAKGPSKLLFQTSTQAASTANVLHQHGTDPERECNTAQKRAERECHKLEGFSLNEIAVYEPPTIKIPWHSSLCPHCRAQMVHFICMISASMLLVYKEICTLEVITPYRSHIRKFFMKLWGGALSTMLPLSGNHDLLDDDIDRWEGQDDDVIPRSDIESGTKCWGG